MKAARFKGLNNVTDPLTMGLEWLTQADNIHITDRGRIDKRGGQVRTLAASLSSAYATIDQQRCYLVSGTTLKSLAGSAAAVTLATGLATTAMHWAEINGQVFYNNGTDRGIIGTDNAILPWAWTVPNAPALLQVSGSLPQGQYQVCCTFTLADGRETGPSDAVQLDLSGGLQISAIPHATGCTTNVYIAPANSSVFGLAMQRAPSAMVWNSSADNLGRELLTADMSPLPAGCDVIQAWGGRLHAAQYLPDLDQSVVWSSQPLGFHLFNLGKDGILLPGRVTMLAPHDKALVMGTDRAVHALTPEGLIELAPYGVVPGAHWSLDDDRTVLFWTTRGVCRALPFSNLTQDNVSVAPSLRAGGAIVRDNGQKRYVVAIQQGGTAFNPR